MLFTWVLTVEVYTETETEIRKEVAAETVTGRKRARRARDSQAAALRVTETRKRVICYYASA